VGPDGTIATVTERAVTTGRGPRRATPEREDFFGKYEHPGTIGRRLVQGYFDAVHALIGRAIDERSVRRAVEIGCGPGFSTQRISAMLPPEVELEASEYVPTLVQAARVNNPGLRVEQEDIYGLNRETASYDLVFLLEVLEHLDDPDLALAEVRRILMPRGLLIVGVPREPIWRILNLARGAYWRRLGNTPGHLNHWSAAGFARYLGACVGEVLEVRNPLPWTLLLVRTA
jgi:SAM-dependent methyltransferase